eukprot:3110230-Heterocapsa_arctica.AAC.1
MTLRGINQGCRLIPFWDADFAADDPLTFMPGRSAASVLRGFPQEAITAGLQGAALAMQASG